MRRVLRSSFLSRTDRRITRLQRRRKARARARAARSKPKPALPGGFGRNLVILIVVGVAFSAWLLRYTDWFESFAGLLALGGVASWLAFVSRIISSKRMEQLQTWTDETILANPRTAWCLVGIVPAGVLIAACFGTVQLNPMDDITRTYGRQGASADLLKGTSRMLVWTGPFGSTLVRIKVSGLPEHEVELSSFDRVERNVPESFVRPVVVLRPEQRLRNAIQKRWNDESKAGKDIASAKVLVNDREIHTFSTYRGEDIVVGSELDRDLDGIEAGALFLRFRPVAKNTVALVINDADNNRWGYATHQVRSATARDIVQAATANVHNPTSQ